MAAALVAWNPVFITYAKQPMSDVPATMWVSLAALMAMRTSTLELGCSRVWRRAPR